MRSSKPEDLDPTDFRHSHPRFQQEHLARNIRMVERLRGLAERYGCSPVQLALAWLLAQGDDIVPIPGTRRIGYLRENVAAAELPLSDEQLAAVSAAVPHDVVSGERYDPSRHGDRRPLTGPPLVSLHLPSPPTPDPTRNPMADKLNQLKLAAVNIDGVLLNDTFSPVIHNFIVSRGGEYTADVERSIFSQPQLVGGQGMANAARVPWTAQEAIDVYFKEREEYTREHPVELLDGAIDLLRHCAGWG